MTKTDTGKNNDIDIDIKIAQLKMRHFGVLFSLVEVTPKETTKKTFGHYEKVAQKGVRGGDF